VGGTVVEPPRPNAGLVEVHASRIRVVEVNSAADGPPMR
jgi:hypothetical protein